MRRTQLVFSVPLGIVFLTRLLVACGGATTPAQPIVVLGDGGSSGDGSDDGPGIVVTQCSADEAMCNGSCVDLTSDSHHCGTCGTVCGTNSSCTNGTCSAQEVPDAGTMGLPPDPGGPAPTSMATTNLAISKLYYGDTDRSGNPGMNAWQSYGLNIDGKDTTASSTHVCTLVAGSSKQVQVDGPGGIDNSFGENIVPILSTLNASFSAQGNASLTGGDSTSVFSITGLGGPGSTFSPVPGTMSRLAPAATPPQWQGNDLRNPDVNALMLSFSSGYENGGVWVGSPPGSFAFDLHIGATGSPTLPMQVIAATLQPSSSLGSATQGNLAAVVTANAFINWLQQIAGAITTSLCSGSAFQSIAQQIQQTSDIVMDAQGNVSNSAGTTCNAISVGLGFDAVAVQLGTPVAVTTPMNPCP